ncbi:MAG: hypothetical protein H0W64_02645 [Gammaproteobacteria bacterium]|nr:hypothetical protein [Gammaproteobacteria bacterium]
MQYISLQLSVPSKTFLLGEYIVLRGGPGLILTTNPRFELYASQHADENHASALEIHADSPAGKLIKSDIFYHSYHITFQDPYQGLGGLGASSAQFVMVFALKNHILDQKINDTEMLKKYLQVAWEGSGTPPSGADVIAQLHGKVCYFDSQSKYHQTFAWPFETLQYCLIHTHDKLATHTHLQQLNYQGDDEVLKRIVKQGIESLEENKAQGFIESINQYGEALKQRNLVASRTLAILNDLAKLPEILASKGCGAMGADIILILFDEQHLNKILTWLQKKQLHIIQYGKDAAHGLEVKAMSI